MMRRLLHVLLPILLGACSSSPETMSKPPPVVPTPAPADEPYDTLEEWHLFADAAAQTPASGVLPYEVVSPLFSDYTTKYRFLYIPKGKKITWEDTERWSLPEGAILVKTFSYPFDLRDVSKGQRLLETRLLVNGGGSVGWKAHTYEWNAQQTSAAIKVAGDTIDATWIDATGATKHNAYTVPNTNVCQQCHGKTGLTSPLGPRTRQWNRTNDYGKGQENQIDHLASLGLLDVAPPPAASRQTLSDPFGAASISDRGRAYLDANCGHCHGVIGLAAGTSFWLDYDHTDPVTGNPVDWGVCKVPASAGEGNCNLSFDVVPGDGAHSIVPCRMGTTMPKVAMPPVGHNLVHAEGVALIQQWIDAMPATGCP